MKIVISSGHGRLVSGAVGYINEVHEVRAVVPKVAEYLRKCGVDVVEYHDNTGTTTAQVINNIVNYHNSQTRDYDVSVHFNAQALPKKDVPLGVEVLYYDAEALASKVSKAIADVSGLKNRGAKKRTDLMFLNSTKKPAILIEVCFVDSSEDVKLYQANFDGICRAIAEALSGKTSSSVDTSKLTPITGKSVATAAQMAAYIKKVNPNVPQSVIDMIPIYLSEGEAEGIRGDGVFAQSCIETGNFAFNNGTAVTIEQNNFCGMAVVNKGDRGNSYAAPQFGIRAQIQHLKAYANTEPLKNALVTPKIGESRFRYVERGIAPYYEWLGAKENPKGKGWATGEGYGSKILTILNSIVNTVVTTLAVKVGYKVKVLNAVTYDGGTFRVYYSVYDVLRVDGDRAVIGIGATITAAVNVKNLQKA